MLHWRRLRGYFNNITTMNTQTAPDFGEPWQSETGDFEIYSKSEHNATAYAESARIRDRIIKCINACVGMQDPAAEIEAMRAAIREAHSVLRDILHNYECGEVIDNNCEAAITKLKPFIS